MRNNSKSTVHERHTKSGKPDRDYIFGRFLGKGGFAKCYEFTDISSNQVYAAKVIPKSSLKKKRAKQKLMSEIKIHRSLNHQNIVKFEHFFEDHDNVYILLGLCQQQTLNELIRRRKRLTELEVQCYLVQLLNAVKYLHQHRVIHRDLKLGNLFLSEKLEINLGDFGLATKLAFDGERKRTICGTPNYIAPEILSGKHGHSYEVDVWSIGVIIYTLLIGKPPFETKDVKTTYKRIRMNAYSFPEHVTVSAEARKLIKSILVTDPKSRPTVEDILQNDFLTKCKIPKLLPVSTLACPPSASYLRQFLPEKQEKDYQHLVNNAPKRLESTCPVNNQAKLQLQERKDFINTDRAKMRGNSSTKSQSPLSQLEENRIKSKIWVKKWVDYSSKYGLGYILSNGAAGVFFNDSTKIILDIKGQKFNYIERGPDRQDIIKSHSLEDYPPDLQKKVTLLQHFRSYLDDEKKKKENKHDSVSPMSKNHVYVKKWRREKHAILFRLSNKVVQVIFQDSTEIVLSSQLRVVTYVNKKHERLTYPLNSALESTNKEMAKRLKYTKDILTHMLGGQTSRSTFILTFLIFKGNGRTTRREGGRVGSKSKGKYSNFLSEIYQWFIGSNVAKSQKGLNYKNKDNHMKNKFKSERSKKGPVFKSTNNYLKGFANEI